MHPLRKPLRFSNEKHEKVHNGPNCLTQNGKCCKRWRFIVIFSFPIKIMQKKKIIIIIIIIKNASQRKEKKSSSLEKTFKVGFSPSKKFFICFNESPLKTMKNTFYFILKALLVLKIFKFLFWHFGHVVEMT